MSEIQGGCRCGAVRYALTMQALPRAYACHCRDCQTWTGSAFSQQIFVLAASLHVTDPLAVYEFITPSGATSIQRMSPVCHTRGYNTNSARPGIVMVRAGTLDRSDELDVAAHIWVKRKQPWLKLPGGVPVWNEAAPAAELLQALTTS